jgi:hypothetical protein
MLTGRSRRVGRTRLKRERTRPWIYLWNLHPCGRTIIYMQSCVLEGLKEEYRCGLVEPEAKSEEE